MSEIPEAWDYTATGMSPSRFTYGAYGIVPPICKTKMTEKKERNLTRVLRSIHRIVHTLLRWRELARAWPGAGDVRRPSATISSPTEFSTSLCYSCPAQTQKEPPTALVCLRCSKKEARACECVERGHPSPDRATEATHKKIPPTRLAHTKTK